MAVKARMSKPTRAHMAATPPRNTSPHFGGHTTPAGASPSQSPRTGGSGGRGVGGGGTNRGSRRQGSGPSLRSTRSSLRSVSPAAPVLAAEYLTCGIIIMVQGLTSPGDYAVKMSQVLWRMTAVTVVFFVLALTSMNNTLNKVSVAFGALIVAGVLYHAGSNIGDTLNELAGKGRTTADGTPTDSATLDAEVTTSPPPHNILM